MAVLGVCAVVTAVAVYVAVRDGSSRSTQVKADGGALHGGRLPESLAGRKAPGFRLEDARGGRLDTSDLAGKPYAVTFLYVRCPDVCPLIGQELGAALKRLGSRARKVAVVGVSVDPRGDTEEAVQRWLRRQRLPRNFHYLIGTESELKPLWNGYYAAPQIPGHPDESVHSAVIWLVDGSGRLRTRFSAGVPVDPADVEHDFRVLLGEAHPGS